MQRGVRGLQEKGVIMKMWIARSKGGLLQLFDTRPIYVQGSWRSDLVYTKSFILNPELFPSVTFENSPQQVEIKLIENEQK